MEVIAEIALIPLVFQLYYTAILFTVLNAVMLYVRISVENRFGDLPELILQLPSFIINTEFCNGWLMIRLIDPHPHLTTPYPVKAVYFYSF